VLGWGLDHRHAGRGGPTAIPGVVFGASIPVSSSMECGREHSAWINQSAMYARISSKAESSCRLRRDASRDALLSKLPDRPVLQFRSTQLRRAYSLSSAARARPRATGKLCDIQARDKPDRDVMVGSMPASSPPIRRHLCRYRRFSQHIRIHAVRARSIVRTRGISTE
jgi:hypothetical protein